MLLVGYFEGRLREARLTSRPTTRQRFERRRASSAGPPHPDAVGLAVAPLANALHWRSSIFSFFGPITARRDPESKGIVEGKVRYEAV
jgi:hypothetical protein